ncbi:MAG: flavodoxin domain-containing protein [Bacteroidales bacterium]|nr:flavodoxin domain-containing protein [Bacteroidales bacterium]
MKKQIIIYGSQYGSTKRYAERLAEMTGIEAVDYNDAKDLGNYDRIIYLGGLFAGGVLGLKKTVSKIAPGQDLVIATVGVTDPNEQSYYEGIRKAIKTQLPASFYDEKNIFHLRGAIDFGQLGFKHRVMMNMFHSMMLKKPKSELTADAKAMLETYGKQVDFVDFDALQAIVEIVKA